MKKALVFVFLLVAIGGGVGPQIANAQTAPPGNTFDPTISDYKGQIVRWDSEANWQAVIMVSLVVLGLVIAACQVSKSKPVKIIAAILGVTTSALTFVNAKVFTADYGSLRRAATEGRAIVAQLEGVVSLIIEKRSNGEDVTQLETQFLAKATEFSNIASRLGGGNTSAGSGVGSIVFGLPPVYAQSVGTAPPWVNQRPSGASFLYYVGAGTDNQLSSAQKASLNDALTKAQQEISGMFPGGSVDAIKTIIDGSYTVQDTFFQFNKQSNSYTYFTLVRVNKLLLNISKPKLQTYQQQGWQPVDLTSQGAMVIALDHSGGVSSIYSDSQGPHINLLFRLPRSLNGMAVAADGSSIYVSAESQLGCTIMRYSLSSHTTDQRLIATGKHCIGIASDGSTLYVMLPDQNQVLYAKNWTARTGTWDLNGTQALGALVYDRFANRLIAADTVGDAYSISLSNGSTSHLVGNLGYVSSLATSGSYILAGSGKSVLFVNRANNSGANPPAGFGPLPGGAIVGVTVDQAGGVWVADYDHKLVEGPFHS